MNVIYPLGIGSIWSDNELRYSLRSLEKHFGELDRVIIAGRLPRWIKSVEHIEAFDDKGNKEKNIAFKILGAAKLTDRFLFMNDDHILTKDIGSDLPNYYNMSIGAMLQRRNAGKIYRQAMINTAELVGYDAHYFDIHVPMIMESKKYIKAIEATDWNKPGAYVLKTLYGAICALPGTELNDYKVNVKKTPVELEIDADARFCISFGDRAVGPGLRMFLEKRYPHKSKFEK